jgi:alpha-1,3-fucosyltransferase
VTFRFDSEVLYNYGKITDIDTNHTISPILKGSIKWKKPDLKYNASSASNYEKKIKDIAIFTSHCATFSRRNLLLQKLTKYLNLDIFGPCGNLK